MFVFQTRVKQPDVAKTQHEPARQVRQAPPKVEEKVSAETQARLSYKERVAERRLKLHEEREKTWFGRRLNWLSDHPSETLFTLGTAIFVLEAPVALSVPPTVAMIPGLTAIIGAIFAAAGATGMLKNWWDNRQQKADA